MYQGTYLVAVGGGGGSVRIEGWVSTLLYSTALALHALHVYFTLAI